MQYDISIDKLELTSFVNLKILIQKIDRMNNETIWN